MTITIGGLMMLHIKALVIVIVIFAAAAAAAAADLAANGIPAPWRVVEFPSIERATNYSWDAAKQKWRARTNCAAAALARPLKVDLQKTPRLRWQWRVLQGLPQNTAAGESTKEGDDFAARVSVMFRAPPQMLGAAAKMRRALREAVAGRPLPDFGLTFVWARAEARGTNWASPHAPERARLFALENAAPSKRWRMAEMDVARAFADAFPQLAAAGVQPAGMALMTDADNLCAAAAAEYARFRWLPPAAL